MARLFRRSIDGELPHAEYETLFVAAIVEAQRDNAIHVAKDDRLFHRPRSTGIIFCFHDRLVDRTTVIDRSNPRPILKMPEPETLRRARRDSEEGKSPSTQAGEFVREQIHHSREGKHGARSTKQAIAIGLSQARRAGVPLPPPKGKGELSRKARRDLKAGVQRQRPSVKRSRARIKALKKEGSSAASRGALSRQAKQAARKRGPNARSLTARKAAQTRQRIAARAKRIRAW